MAAEREAGRGRVQSQGLVARPLVATTPGKALK